MARDKPKKFMVITGSGVVYRDALAFAKREGDTIVLDPKAILTADSPVYPGCIDYDAESDTHLYTCLEKAGRLRLYPLFDMVEQGTTYVVVKRVADGQLFKVVYLYAAEILLNIHLNSGITLEELIGLECMIEAEEYPERFQDEQSIEDFVYGIIETVAFLAYEAELVKIEEE